MALKSLRKKLRAVLGNISLLKMKFHYKVNEILILNPDTGYHNLIT